MFNPVLSESKGRLIDNVTAINGGLSIGVKEIYSVSEMNILQPQRKKKKRCMSAIRERGHFLSLAGGGIG